MIWIATRSYDGSLAIDVSGGALSVEEPGGAGTARIFQIDSNDHLVERRFDEAW